MTTIARAYELESKAKEAASKLLEQGISERQIQILAPDSAGVAAGLRAGKALQMLRESEALALALDKGHTVLVAETPFGTAVAMTRVLDSCDPVELELTTGLDDPYGRASPLSFALGWPVLMRNSPAPFSTVFGLSVEPGKQSMMGKYFGELIGSSRSLSAMFRLPMLTKNGGTTLGKELHHEHLHETAMGIPLLKRDLSPLAVTSLPHEPTPLSSLLKIPVLTKKQ